MAVPIGSLPPHMPYDAMAEESESHRRQRLALEALEQRQQDERLAAAHARFYASSSDDSSDDDDDEEVMAAASSSAAPVHTGGKHMMMGGGMGKNGGKHHFAAPQPPPEPIQYDQEDEEEQVEVQAVGRVRSGPSVRPVPVSPELQQPKHRKTGVAHRDDKKGIHDPVTRGEFIAKKMPSKRDVLRRDETWWVVTSFEVAGIVPFINRVAKRKSPAWGIKSIKAIGDWEKYFIRAVRIESKSKYQHMSDSERIQYELQTTKQQNPEWVQTFVRTPDNRLTVVSHTGALAIYKKNAKGPIDYIKHNHKDWRGYSEREKRGNNVYHTCNALGERDLGSIIPVNLHVYLLSQSSATQSEEDAAALQEAEEDDEDDEVAALPPPLPTSPVKKKRAVSAKKASTPKKLKPNDDILPPLDELKLMAHRSCIVLGELRKQWEAQPHPELALKEWMYGIQTQLSYVPEGSDAAAAFGRVVTTTTDGLKKVCKRFQGPGQASHLAEYVIDAYGCIHYLLMHPSGRSMLNDVLTEFNHKALARLMLPPAVDPHLAVLPPSPEPKPAKPVGQMQSVGSL